ncbi:LysR family transcriptional regulator YfeR [Candidatus Burkholderia pumila]|uniref:LysR family transcriptional regulator YfeR n=1 Tax=Candidatus Burkholderia pumila TaxID=1090375 RepID=A0ABR5HME1_9BURK|nr:LysR family transcriptional regulator YfeR [Candidatus Burkholderia pumila]
MWYYRSYGSLSKLRSFSRADDEIGLTQSAVSRCVRELEGEIGLKLIDRTTRDVQLTDVSMNLVGTVLACLPIWTKRCAKSATSASRSADAWSSRRVQRSRAR